MFAGNLPRILAVCALAVSTLILGVSSVRADILPPYNQLGASVDFLGITERSGTDPLPPSAFGPHDPNAAGTNTLLFNAMNFSAHAASTGGADLTDVQLSMTMAAHNGFGINTISLLERGTFQLGGASMTGRTVTSVSVPLMVLNITKVQGIGSITPISVPGTMVFTPSDHATLMGTVISTGWTGTVTYNIAGALASAGYAGKLASAVAFSYDNALSAVSEPGNYAFADKQLARFDVTTTLVPEPGTLALLGVAAIGLCGYTWRKKRRSDCQNAV